MAPLRSRVAPADSQEDGDGVAAPTSGGAPAAALAAPAPAARVRVAGPSSAMCVRPPARNRAPASDLQAAHAHTRTRSVSRLGRGPAWEEREREERGVCVALPLSHLTQLVRVSGASALELSAPLDTLTFRKHSPATRARRTNKMGGGGGSSSTPAAAAAPSPPPPAAQPAVDAGAADTAVDIGPPLTRNVTGRLMADEVSDDGASAYGSEDASDDEAWLEGAITAGGG